MVQERSMNLVTLEDTAIQPLMSEQAQATLTNRIERFNESHPLVPHRDAKALLIDLAWQMTEKPKLKQCSPESLFRCLLFAADTGSGLGPHGVHLVPRALKDDDDQDPKKVLTAMPVLSANRKEAILVDWYGYDRLEVHYVFLGDQFKVIRDNGVIVGVEHTQDDMGPRPSPEAIVRVYSVAIHKDGSRRYHVSYAEDINDRKNKSSSKNKQGQVVGPWKDTPFSMVRKTQAHIATDDIVGDFSAGAMQIAGANLPEGSMIAHTDYTDVETEATEDEARTDAAESRTTTLGAQLDKKLAETVKSTPAKEAKPEAKPATEEKPVGFAPEELLQIRKAIETEALKGEKHLVAWFGQEYAAWVFKAGKDVVDKELTTLRNDLLAQLKASK